MTTISVTYDLKIDGSPGISALIARLLIDYISVSGADIQLLMLDSAYSPDDSELEEQVRDVWNDDSCRLDVELGQVVVRADPSLREGDTVAAASLIDDYIHHNVYDRALTPSAKIDILNLSTGSAVYQTLNDRRLVGNLSPADIAAGRGLLIRLLAAGVQLKLPEVQP